MIGYVKKESDGAYKCFCYAKECGALIMNIAD